MSQMVQVVSILEVMMRLGDRTFQSREVIGAVCSGDFELDNSASGASFWIGCSLEMVDLLIVFDWRDCASFGRDHNRRWSPEVASRSVLCLVDEGGSHNMRVTGYE